MRRKEIREKIIFYFLGIPQDLIADRQKSAVDEKTDILIEVNQFLKESRASKLGKIQSKNRLNN